MNQHQFSAPGSNWHGVSFPRGGGASLEVIVNAGTGAAFACIAAGGSALVFAASDQPAIVRRRIGGCLWMSTARFAIRPGEAEALAELFSEHLISYHEAEED